MASTTFPQADSLPRVIATVAAARTGINLETLATTLSVSARQARYYADAASYLGLASYSNGMISSTTAGKGVVRVRTTAGRANALSRIISERPVFRRALKAVRSGKPATRKMVAAWIRQHGKLAPSTAMRRAGTVENWVQAVA